MSKVFCIGNGTSRKDFNLEKLRPYLIGVKFTVFSDHESLSYLNASKINSGRLARIIEQLSDYDFTIEYKKGTN